MMKFPLTHFDSVREHRPKMFLALVERAASIRSAGLPGNPLTMDEMATLGYTKDLKLGLEDVYDFAWDNRGEAVRRRGATRSDMMREMQAAGQTTQMLEAIGFEYALALNMLLFESLPIHIGEDMSSRVVSADTDKLPSALIALPKPANLLVIPGAAARTALHAVAGQADPGFGTVNVYANLSRRDDHRHLLLFAVNDAGRDITMAAKREMKLSDGGTLGDALRTEWEPTAAGRGDRKFFEEGLPFFRMVLNLLLEVSRVADDIRTATPPA